MIKKKKQNSEISCLVTNIKSLSQTELLCHTNLWIDGQPIERLPCNHIVNPL